MIPAQGAGFVTPSQRCVGTFAQPRRDGIRIKFVLTQVAAQVEPVLIVELIIEFGIKVLEIISANAPSIGSGEQERGGQQIKIRPTRRNNHGGFVLENGAFGCHIGRNVSDTSLSAPLVHVAVLHSDIQDTGKPSTETGWESSFGKGGILDGIPVENREKPE